MDLTTAPGAITDEFLREFLRSPAWRGGGMVVRSEPDANGAVEATVYLAKKGSQLPFFPID